MKNNVKKRIITFLLVVFCVNTSVQVQAAENCSFYLTEEKNTISEDYIRVYSMLEKSVGAECTSASIEVYQIDKKQGFKHKKVVDYTESYAPFSNYANTLQLPINYTIGKNKEIDVVLPPAEYYYRMTCSVDGNTYQTGFGKFVIPVNNEVTVIEEYGREVDDNPGDYTGWSQYDQRWASVLLGNGYDTSNMANIGCLVTSFSKIAVSTGIRNPEEGFDPGFLCQRLNEAKAFDCHGNLSFEGLQKVLPEISFYTSIENPGWEEELKKYMQANQEQEEFQYAAIAHINTIFGSHFCQVEMSMDDEIRLNNSWNPENNRRVPFAEVSTSANPIRINIYKVDTSSVPCKEYKVVEPNQSYCPAFEITEDGAKVMKNLKKTTKVSVVAKVSFRGQELFKTINGLYVPVLFVNICDSVPELKEVITVTKEDAPLRMIASNQGEVVKRLEEGELLQVKRKVYNESGNLWYQSSEGFIYSGNVK